MSQIQTKFIANTAVTAAKLASDSVTTVKILDANVTNAKVATGIDATKLADGSVTNAELQFINTLTSNAQTQLNDKASTTLNNLGVVAANANLDPSTDATFNLGATGNAWDVIRGYTFSSSDDVHTIELDGSISMNTDNGVSINDSGATNGIVLNTEAFVSIQSPTGPATALRFYNDATTFYAAVKAPGSLAANYTLTLPADDGTPGQVLSTDGSGVLSFITPAGETRAKETFTLSAGDITNQFITLANAPSANSVHFIVKGGAPTLEGASHDYSVSGAQVNFLNDLATGGNAALIAGDIVQVVYEY